MSCIPYKHPVDGDGGRRGGELSSFYFISTSAYALLPNPTSPLLSSPCPVSPTTSWWTVTVADEEQSLHHCASSRPQVFYNNFITMDISPIELEAKSRERKSHKGKKTTTKVQDDFLKIHDEKDSEGKSKDHELKATTTPIKKKKVKKRVVSDVCPSSERNCIPAGEMQEFGAENILDEPTMEEKLASLDLLNDDKSKSSSKQEPSPTLKLPSADSVHILLKQALHAEDHALLLECLYTRDEKVIEKSISLLNPAEVLKLLASLKSMLSSRGAVLVCALPWLRSLLSQHASSIASQQSSLLILNSLYQLIDSRISTFSSAVQLSTCLDYLFAGIPGDEADEEEIPPVVYEDKDSEEEESEIEMEIDEASGELGVVNDASRDSDGSEVMSN